MNIQGRLPEVSAYRIAPHKGVIRGIPVSETPRDIAVSIVNERNPLALGAKGIVTTTTIIVAFCGSKVPNYVRYGSALMKCQLYRKQVDVCHASVTEKTFVRCLPTASAESAENGTPVRTISVRRSASSAAVST